MLVDQVGSCELSGLHSAASGQSTAMNAREIENYEYRQIISQARALAKKWGHGDIADDFAQEAALKLFTHGKVYLETCLIDFLRSEYGRTGSPSGDRRILARSRTTSLDAPAHADVGGAAGEGRQLLHECIASPPGDPEPIGSAWRAHVAFRGTALTVADLWLDRELDQESIAAVLGVTPSRISQISRAVEREVERAAVLAEALAIYHDDKDASLLEVDWIQF